MAGSRNTRTAGPALVYLRDGRVYEGDAERHGATITIRGKQRVTVGPSYAKQPTHRAPVVKTFPGFRVKGVRWLDGDPQ